MADSSEHTPPSQPVLPVLGPRYSVSWPLCFCTEPSHCFEERWSVEWELLSLPCGLQRSDCLRYHPRLNYALKRGAEVFQSESQKPQRPPGKVEKDQHSHGGEPDPPSTGLLSIQEKGLEPESCDDGDHPESDPASAGPRCLSCWPWLQRAFGWKPKTRQNIRRPDPC